MEEPVPAEGTIKALLEQFVAPLLAVEGSDVEVPDKNRQLMVGKQMHAVVVLYNYYHLKRSQKLTFLDPESFCKICCAAKPGLKPFMRLMDKSEDYSDLHDELSITKKIIVDSCRICTGLDSHRATPDINGWPISTVAVLLVDPSREKCLLHSLDGCWSLVEKVIKDHDKGVKLEQLGFSAVEKETGIIQSELRVLRQDLTYSLTHEKATTRLYIMSYERAECNDKLAEVPIEDIKRDLEGPIVQKCSSDVATSSVVEFYALLPYIDIISDWFSRKDSHLVERNRFSGEEGMDNSTIKLSRSESSAKVSNKKSLTSRSENRESTPHHALDGFTIQEKSIEEAGNVYILSSKETSDAIKYTKKRGRPSKAAYSSKVPISKCNLMQEVGGKLSSDGDIGKKYLSGSCDQNLNTKSNRMSKAEAQTTGDPEVNDFPSNLESLSEVDRFQIGGDITEMEPGSLQRVKDNSRAEKSQIGKSKLNVSFKNNSNTQDADEVIIPYKDEILTRDNHLLNKGSDSRVQKLDMNSNKMSRSESRTSETHRNCSSSKNGTSCHSRQLDNVGGISKVDADNLFSLTDNTKSSKTFQSMQCKESKISEDNSEIEVPRNTEGGVKISKGNGLSLDYNMQLHSRENISQRNVVTDTYMRRISVNNGLTAYVGSNDKVDEDNSTKKGCTTKCIVEKRSDGSDSYRDGLPSGNLPLAVDYIPSEDSAFCHLLASKQNDLLQTCLRILQKKEDELNQQQRLLEDEMARNETNIQTILSEEDSPLKAEIVMNTLNSMFSTQMQKNVDTSPVESSSQGFKRRKLSEANFSSMNPSQELDEICRMNSWILPRYRVRPDDQNTGSFKATVTIEGVDFDCSAVGDSRSSPLDARSNAAAQLLMKLRRNAMNRM